MKEIDLQGNNATVKDKNMYSILELVLEMYERGYEFCRWIYINHMQANF